MGKRWAIRNHGIGKNEVFDVDTGRVDSTYITFREASERAAHLNKQERMKHKELNRRFAK